MLYNEFWDWVDVRGQDDCWEWTRARVPPANKHLQIEGYGCLFDPTKPDRSQRGAHVVAWEKHNKASVMPGVHVRHTCDNPPCCNPHHLVLGRALENQRDRRSRGRHGPQFVPNEKGSQRYNAKLTDDIVREIRRMKREEGIGAPTITKRLGNICSVATVDKVLAGTGWAHVA